MKSKPTPAPSTERARNEQGQYVSNKAKGGKTKLNEEERIMQHIIELAIDRSYADTARWQNGLIRAMDPILPSRVELYDLYYSLKKDLHYQMLRKQLIMWLTSGTLQIKDRKSKKIDDDLTELFEKSWFEELTEQFVEEIFGAHQLLQFTEMNPASMTIKFEVVEQKHVHPEFGTWTKEQYDLPTAGFNYRDSPKEMAWLLEIGKPSYLGALDPMAPWIIWKKCAGQAWSSFSDRFGIPLAKGKTNVNDKKSVSRMERFFNRMNGASWAIIDHADDIEFVQQTGTDAYEVFDKKIERANSEMSKAILLSIMSNDVGKNGSRAQSETHKHTSDDVKMSLRKKYQNFITEKVLPLLALHGFATDGMVAQYVREISVSKDDNDQDQWLVDTFEMDEKALDHFREKYGVPLMGFKAKPVPPLPPGPPTPPEDPTEPPIPPKTAKKIKNAAELVVYMHGKLAELYTDKCEHHA